MNYCIHLYYETNCPLFNPITNIQQPITNGTLFLPLNHYQLTKLNNIITSNTYYPFSKLQILSSTYIATSVSDMLKYYINKQNYIINNYYLPTYYIIEQLENFVK